ncbi:MAG TPA: oxygenase MpaB family protein, partial [Pyrinomonadaceae bacterium]|nr:oxygenase MpaB family protein [Pyrinomonadaceae bacterium]
VKVGQSEAEAYVHTWNVAGYLMGIREELLPRDAADAAELMSVFGRRQFQPSEAGRRMTAALVRMLEEQTPGTLFDGLPSTMIRHLAGERVADIIGLPPSDWTKKLVLGPMRAVFGVGEELKGRGPILGHVSERFSAELLEGLAWLGRGGERAPFRIPESLRDEWGLRAHPTAAFERASGGVRHPLENLTAANRRRVFRVMLALSVLLTAVMTVVGWPLQNEAAQWGVLSFEFAYDAETARRVVNSWGAGGQLRAAFNLGLDFLFLFAYSTATALACLWAVNLFRARRAFGLVAAGVGLAWGQWVAGALDAAENVALLRVLLGGGGEAWPRTAYFCAAAKFALVFAGLLYVLAGLAARAASRLKG